MTGASSSTTSATVNQAARFEPACKIFTVLIMIGQSTYDMAKDKIEVHKLGLLVAKGKKQAVGVYELWPRRANWTRR